MLNFPNYVRKIHKMQRVVSTNSQVNHREGEMVCTDQLRACVGKMPKNSH